MNLDRFAGLNVQVLGISIDHKPCLKAWADSLGGISYPLLSDFWPHGGVAKDYGVFRKEGTTERAIFVIDKDGILQYIDIHDIGEQPSNDVLFTELERVTGQKMSTPVGAAPLPEGDVLMYCTSWCPDCKRARAWLKAHNLSVVEIDIDKNLAAAKHLKELANNNLSTPTFEFKDGTVIVNFDEKKLSARMM